METRSIVCPSCEARLKIAATLPAGKKIKCPKCEESFAVPAEEEEVVEAAEVVPARKRKAALPPNDDLEEEEEEEYAEARRRRARPKRAKQSGGNRALLVGLLVGAFVLLLGGGGVLAFVLWPAKAKPAQIAQQNNTAARAQDPAPANPPSGIAAPAPSGEAASSGRQVFDANNCGRCHALGGGAAPRGKRGGGPDLAHVGSKRDVAWLMDHVRDPKSHNPSSRMPRYPEDKISPQDLRALGEYLASLK